MSNRECVCFPAAFCFANTPHRDQIDSFCTHNGNAAGNTREEAILQEVLELIERDAAAIWWYNLVSGPEITLDVIPEERRGIKLYTYVEKLDVPVDLDCVAVGGHIGARNAIELLEKGIPVLVEHPVSAENG